ncbi:RNA-binding domain-containing protein [Ephemerocybe angulata]|uniref:RNA-binding domain-containing protein n=1 Tax=Ephemerocybe angulata TaxID=980116 RepID=A0A8H6LWV0_9AGAR|nr:RNA-binding domain-containing protein [Tulosesus angulatus]
MLPPYTADVAQTSTSRLSPPSAPASSSSDSSSTATLPSASGIHHLATTIDPQVKQFAPSNDAIEAAIQAAISSSTASASRSSPSFNGSGNRSATSDGRTVPPRDTRTQLFIGNLPYRVRWQDLKDLFRRAGTVLRADVSLGADNRSRGYGTVLLATAEDAGRAIDMFNGYEWQSRLLEVRVDRIGGPTTQPGEPGMSSMSGAVMGGVTMMSSGLYAGQQQQSTQGIPSSSSPFTSQGQNPPYPSHQQQHIFSPQPQLPYHVQWQDLKDLFRRTPGGVTVLRADVALGPDGRSKGFGTVTLRTEEEAERAKRWFSG